MPLRRTSSIGRLGTAVAVSLLMHVPVVLGLLALFPEAEDGFAAAKTLEPIQLVDEAEDRDPDRELQIVSLDKPKVEQVPDKAKVLDRYNQKVEKETVRKRKQGRPGGVRVHKRNKKARAAQEPAKAKEEPTPDSDPDDEGTDAIAAADDSRELDEREDKDAPSDGEPSELDAKDILPNMDNVVGNGGDTAIKDYLDVPEGEKDLINRKQTRYWSFFDRMKRGVKRQWNPNDVYRVNDPRRQVYGVEDRMTVLKVTLDGNGAVHQIIVEKPSGAPFLDKEAKRAFRAASPFPNPPEGLKDEQGRISLRFGFFLDIESRGSRIIRFRR
jgi:TonB family protein